MRFFLILLISFYQRFISPCKGFHCAYGYYHHGVSCSGQVKLILRKHGVVAGWPLIRRQFWQCRQAYVALAEASRGAEFYRMKFYRINSNRLLLPVKQHQAEYLKIRRAKIYLYLPIGARVAGSREMGYFCCCVL